MATNKCKPLPMLTAQDIERFRKYVDVRGPYECWPWKGARIKDGRTGEYTYGVLCVGGKNIRANRISLRLATGEDPYPFHVLHSCDNPPCCNPAHLWEGNDQDNNEDKAAKGRSLRGTANPHSKLDDDSVRAIRDRIASGEGITSIGRSLGLTKWCISDIKQGRSWKHVTTIPQS